MTSFLIRNTLKFSKVRYPSALMPKWSADEFDQPIEDEREFFIKLGTENAEESDDVAVVEANTHDFDVSTLIYEYITLAVPMHRVHPEGQCNPEVIALLSKEEASESDEETIDPRWAALKDIKLEDNK